MITIMLAEDHTIVREGFKTLLNTVPDFQVIGENGAGLVPCRGGVFLPGRVRIVPVGT